MQASLVQRYRMGGIIVTVIVTHLDSLMLDRHVFQSIHVHPWLVWPLGNVWWTLCLRNIVKRQITYTSTMLLMQIKMYSKCTTKWLYIQQKARYTSNNAVYAKPLNKAHVNINEQSRFKCWLNAGFLIVYLFLWPLKPNDSKRLYYYVVLFYFINK